MMKNLKSYIDANIFLNAILYEDDRAIECKKILNEIVKKEITGFTSYLTWDEIIYVINKISGKEIALRESEKFLQMPNLTILEVNIKTIKKAQSILGEFNLRPRDAIHLASALNNDCDYFISDDSDFEKAKELIKIKNPNQFPKNR